MPYPPNQDNANVQKVNYSVPIVEELDQSLSGSEQQIQVRYRVANVQNAFEAITAIRNPNYFTNNPKPSNRYAYWPYMEADTGDAIYGRKDTSLYLSDVKVDEITSNTQTFPPVSSLGDIPGNAQYIATAIYKHRAVCPVIEYDMQSTTRRITHSVVTRKSFNADGDILNQVNESKYVFDKAVEVDMQNVQQGMKVKGTQKVFPAMRLNVRWNPDTAPFQLNTSSLYYSILNDSIGTINSCSFLGFDTGSVLFIGANARLIDVINKFYEINYTFEVLPNQAAWSGIGAFSLSSPIKLYGHDYVWSTREMKQEDVKQKNSQGNTETIKQTRSKVTSLHVERIYEWEDHNRFFRYPFSQTHPFNWTSMPLYDSSAGITVGDDRVGTAAPNPATVFTGSLNPKLRYTSYVKYALYSPIRNCPVSWGASGPPATPVSPPD